MLAGALMLAGSNAFAAGMGVSFDWGPTKKCLDPKSPPIALSNVPQGTVNLEIKMIDQNASFSHGGGKVAPSSPMMPSNTKGLARLQARITTRSR